MRQNEKALLLALISFLSLNRLCPKSAPEHIIIVQSSPGIHYFYPFFCGKYYLGLLNAPYPTIFDYFCRKIMPLTSAPDHIIFGPGPHYFLLFWKKIFSQDCPGPAPDLVRSIVTLLPNKCS